MIVRTLPSGRGSDRAERFEDGMRAHRRHKGGGNEMKRRIFLALLAGAAPLAFGFGQALAQDLPKLAVKDKYKVGFAQTESNNPWRIAQTESMKSEAGEARLPARLHRCRRLGRQAGRRRQQHDRPEGRPDLPRAARGEAADPGRDGRQAGGHSGLPASTAASIRPWPRPAATTSPSSARLRRGRARAPPSALDKAANGKAQIIQLQGTVGASPANDRRKGFEDSIKDQPGMKIIASQSGDFARDKGRQVAETLLQAHPDATAIYAHNDEMAMGAIAAMEAAGKTPGKDVVIVARSTARVTRSRRSSTARCWPPSSATRNSGRKRSRSWRCTPRARPFRRR